MLAPTRPTNAAYINKRHCQHTDESTIQLTRVRLRRCHFAFAVADCVLNQTFINQQRWVQEKLHILFAAIRC